MEIRVVTEDDLPNLVSIQHEFHEQHRQAFPTYYRASTDEELLAGMKEFIATGHARVWMASVGAAPAGFLTLRIDAVPENFACYARSEAVVDQMAVASQFRRRGVGRALMSQAEQYAKSQACDGLRLGVLATNAAAREFYAAVGFAPFIERWRMEL
jgi:diamine N-acetyltransferase